MLRRIKKYFSGLGRRLYRQRRLRLVLDLSLIAVIFILAAAIFSLIFYRPQMDFFRPTPRPDEPIIIVPSLESSFVLKEKNTRLPANATLDVRLKNKGQVNIVGLRLNFISQTNSFSVTKIELVEKDEISSSGLQISSSTIILPEIAPDQELEFSLLVNFRSAGIGRLISWRVESEYQASNKTLKDSISLAEIRVAAGLPAQVAAYYNSPQGDQLGSGPLPPVVGFPTNFWIFFRVQPEDDFRNFSLSARLPKNVSLMDDSSLLAGDLRYNADSRQIIWQINEIKSGSGDYRAGFEIQLIPSEADLEKFVNLLENIKFQAVDNFTGLTIEGTAAAVTTNLDNDVFNRGEGRVISIEDL